MTPRKFFWNHVVKVITCFHQSIVGIIIAFVLFGEGGRHIPIEAWVTENTSIVEEPWGTVHLSSNPPVSFEQFQTLGLDQVTVRVQSGEEGLRLVYTGTKGKDAERLSYTSQQDVIHLGAARWIKSVSINHETGSITAFETNDFIAWFFGFFGIMMLGMFFSIMVILIYVSLETDEAKERSSTPGV